MADNSRKVATIALVGILIINLIIGIYFFQFLSKTSEFVGALFSLWAKIKIIFVCSFLSIVFSVIIYLVCKKTNGNVTLILSIVFFLSVVIANYKICSSIACPKPLTTKELIKNREKRIKEYKNAADKLLKEAKLFLPDEKTICEDKTKLIQGIQNLLLSFGEQSTEFEGVSDSIRISLINGLLGMNYREPDTNAFKIISDSLECNFICYSPNYTHFISILTYKDDVATCDLDFYNGLVLFCKKEKGTISVFPYTNALSQGNKYTREEFLYTAISGHFFHMGCYSLKMEGFQEHLHPFNKDFWESKYFFDTITIEDTKYLRYQTKVKYDFETSKNVYVKREVCEIKT